MTGKPDCKAETHTNAGIAEWDSLRLLQQSGSVQALPQCPHRIPGYNY